jgi:3-oxoacyl-[acyl-carrier-protein] synthase-3
VEIEENEMAHIRGFGHHLPDRVVTNVALAAEFGVDPEWIRSVCGIEERRYAAPGEGVDDLAHRAALACLEACGAKPSDLGGIIVGTGTPSRQFPGVSAEVQRRLGVTGIPAFDIHLASAGSIFALAAAVDFCPRYGPVLAIGAEHMTGVMARPPRVKETAILFGDGAGACLVCPGDGPLVVVDVRIGSDATFADDLCMNFGETLTMNGRTVILQANRKLQACIADLLGCHHLTVVDIGLFLFHQANRNLLKQVGQSLGIEESKVFLNLERCGNTSCASLLVAASEAHAQGLFTQGSGAVMAAFGAGMSWGAALLHCQGAT